MATVPSDNLGEIFSDINGNLFVQNSNGTFVQIVFNVNSTCLAVKNDEVDKNENDGDDERSVASVFDGMVDEDEMDDEDDEDNDEDNDEFSIASVFDGMVTSNNAKEMDNSDDDEEDD
jgi:hypothetical protein